MPFLPPNHESIASMTRQDFRGYGGIRLATDVFGSPEDPAVLLIPSAGHSRSFWHGAAEALAAAGRYAICIDMRGHGESERSADGVYSVDTYVADVKAILSALPTRAAIVASGLGALITILTVGEGTPHLVSGLALIDATIWFDPVVAKRLSDAFHLRAGAFDDPTAALEAIAAMHPNEPRPAATARFLSAFAQRSDGRYEWRCDPRVLGSTNVLEEVPRLEAAASRIAAPVILIRGALNDSVSAESVQRLGATIPGAELAEIEGAGHYAAVDREDVFNALLLDFLERRAPRAPLSYVGGAEPRVLRDALGCFATGVTVVTTVSESGTPFGLTANSFTSVSLDPPLVLFSLARSSTSLSTFAGASRFAVNVLHIGQQPLSGRFAQRDVARFEGVEWAIRVPGGSPILGNSLASFDCQRYSVHDGGDHLIFIGQVTHAWFEPRRDPLLYFRGKYRRLHFA
jgi:flavin reductase (DIM6/NTAB) family NADH-FMN oxidoreductase RutF/pimeloyl-ACP methyl ester carboxylesterase